MDAVSLQTGSGQDYSVCGQVNDTRYIAVFDGHGGNKCIDYVRTLTIDDIMMTKNPALTLWELIESENFYNSGTTFTMARITGTLIEIWNMGDSETHVFINKEHVYKTDVHTFNNPSEVIRTVNLVDSIESFQAPFPVSDTCIENIESPVGHFKTGESLVPSQSLGHNGMTGFAPCFKQIRFESTDEVRIVCGSDGLFDMLVDVSTGNVVELAKEAERRWRQEWKYLSYKTTYGGVIDDISCAIWEN